LQARPLAAVLVGGKRGLGPPRRIYDPDARGMSVAEFVQNALRKSLIDAGFIDDEGQA